MASHGFEILRQIGRGGMGTVYLARQRSLNREVAIKVLDNPADERLVGKFQREALLQGRLQHPHVAQVYDIIEHGGRFCIVMEWIRGLTISQLTELLGALPTFLIRKVGLEIGGALAAVHRAGFVHRDVKGANIMLTDDLFSKLMDFGIATFRPDPGTLTGQTTPFLGTPSYMSPEQLRGLPLDGRSDLFSFGLVLYQMATGIRPIQEESLSGVVRAIEHGTFDPRKDNPHVDPQLRTVILRCLAKRPDDRYPDADHLVTALQSMAEPPRVEVPVAEYRARLTAGPGDPWSHGGPDGDDADAPTLFAPVAAGAAVAADPGEGPTVVIAPPPDPPTGAPMPTAASDASSPPPQPGPVKPARRWLVAMVGLAILAAVAVWFFWLAGPTARPDPGPRQIPLYCTVDLAPWLELALRTRPPGLPEQLELTVVAELSPRTRSRIETDPNGGFLWVPSSSRWVASLPPAAGDRLGVDSSLCSTPVVLLLWRSRYESLEPFLPRAALLRGLGGLAARQATWEDLGEPAHGHQPTILAPVGPGGREHLLLELVLVANYFDILDVSQRHVAHPDYRAWRRDLARYVQPMGMTSRELVETFLVNGSSQGDGLFTLESLAIEYGERLAAAWEPVVVLYPEVTEWCDHPLVAVHPASGPDRDLEATARLVGDWLRQRDNQVWATQSGFRPVNAEAMEQLGADFFQRYAELGVRRSPGQRILHIEPEVLRTAASPLGSDHSP